MSKKVLDRLEAEFGERVLEKSSFRGDDEVTVARKDWVPVAEFLRNDGECSMDMFTDLTAVDYPEREPEEPRFEVLLLLRSMARGHRVRMKVQVGEGETLATLTGIWRGTGWAEREIYDMFGIRFDGHSDLRRILLYDEFEGYPLRKDYPIAKAQPLVEYRQGDGLDKLWPFGDDEGQPWGRIDWAERLAGGNAQVSPSIAQQQGQIPALSASTGEVAPVSAEPAASEE